MGMRGAAKYSVSEDANYGAGQAYCKMQQMSLSQLPADQGRANAGGKRRFLRAVSALKLRRGQARRHLTATVQAQRNPHPIPRRA